MAEKDCTKSWMMLSDGELGNPSSFSPSSSSSNGVVSPTRLYDNPLRPPRYDDQYRFFVRSPSSFGRAASQTSPSSEQYSPSSYSSAGFFGFSEDGGSSLYSAPSGQDSPKFQTQGSGFTAATTTRPCSSNGFWSNYSNYNSKPHCYYKDPVNDLGLNESFYRMNIHGDNPRKEQTKTRMFGVEGEDGSGSGFGFGFGFGHEDFNSFGSHNMRSRLIGLEHPRRYVGDSRNSGPGFINNSQMGYYSWEVQSLDSFARPFLDSDGEKGLIRGSFSPDRPQRNPGLNMTPPLIRTKLNPRCEVNDLEGFSCEDSFILEGKGVWKNSFHNDDMIPNARDKSFAPRDCHSSYGGTCEDRYGIQTRVPSSVRLRSYIYTLAKDHNGCRDLQKLVDYGTYQDKRVIFEHIIDHVVELSTDQFGNYLVQKLLDVGNEFQKREIALVLARKPGQLVRISLNSHGTRVVQKLIESAKDEGFLSLVLSALAPGFLALIMDSNGNHVLRRCLECLNREENAFIFNAAARFCVEIATHQSGCCLLQKCVEHSTGYFRHQLVAEITKNALLLAQDPFGNYVIQFLMDLIPSVTTKLIRQFSGHFVHLSKQRCSSHVVEKFLNSSKESHAIIVDELIRYEQFETLFHDAYANYVLSTALNVTKGAVYRSLNEKVNSFKHNLQINQYNKKLISLSSKKK